MKKPVVTFESGDSVDLAEWFEKSMVYAVHMKNLGDRRPIERLSKELAHAFASKTIESAKKAMAKKPGAPKGQALIDELSAIVGSSTSRADIYKAKSDLAEKYGVSIDTITKYLKK
jgi:hypothetical protein